MEIVSLKNNNNDKSQLYAVYNIFTLAPKMQIGWKWQNVKRDFIQILKEN